LFASERQNVIKAVDFIHGSPLIGPKVPVHGLLIEIETGRLEWLVNGYETLGSGEARAGQATQSGGGLVDELRGLSAFNLGEMKFPEGKIGEMASTVAEEFAKVIHAAAQPQLGEAAHGTSTIRVPVGFKVEQVEIPTSKIGEAVASVGEGIAQRLVRKHGIPFPQDTSSPGQAPPKIPIPPPIRPKVLLRRGPK
jgi:hypothetical protein